MSPGCLFNPIIHIVLFHFLLRQAVSRKAATRMHFINKDSRLHSGIIVHYPLCLIDARIKYPDPRYVASTSDRADNWQESPAQIILPSFSFHVHYGSIIILLSFSFHAHYGSISMFPDDLICTRLFSFLCRPQYNERITLRLRNPLPHKIISNCRHNINSSVISYPKFACRHKTCRREKANRRNSQDPISADR